MADTLIGAGARYVPALQLREWASSVLKASGVRSRDAVLVGDSLVQTSLWGIDTHGIARLPHYLRRIEAGSINRNPKLVVDRTGAATASLDGDHGLGIVVCDRAMKEAIALARQAGIGMVGCLHSTHCGALGLYGRQAAREQLVGIALTHADAIVVPHGGIRAFLGTNPICITVPSAEGDAVCLDMATSGIPFNRVMNARRDGYPLPEGKAVDKYGVPTTDSHAAAALLPLGEHKGYAMAFLIDVLCGPLNAMPFGPHIPAMYGDLAARRNLGSVMIAVDPARFSGGSALKDRVAAMAAEARAQPARDPTAEVLVPGDPEYRRERERSANGIPVEPALAGEIREWSRRLGVLEPETLSAPSAGQP